jgi:hypothetical protein
MDTQPVSSQASLTFDIEQFKQLYKTFSSETPAQLPKLYHATVTFKDPIHELNGIAALTHYFANFCKPDTQYRFEFTNELVTHDQAFFQWKMHYAHAQLANGKNLQLNGGTLIKFNTHIIYHEDFYDMGAMIYQHIPILGWAVGKINARVAGQSS